MAGTVAKRPVHNFKYADLQLLKKSANVEGDRQVSDHLERSASETMDEDDVLAQLEDDRFSEQRPYILDDLTQKVRRDGGRLPFDNRHALFRGLTLVLLDQNWEVRLKCIQFICELIPQFGQELDSCMAIVLPQVVANLGDSRVAIRKAVVQTIHIHMKHTTNVQQIFSIIVTHGLQSRDPKVRIEATIQLPVLLTREFASVDLSSVTHALAKKFCEDKDKTFTDTAGTSLERIKTLVGKQQFDFYIQQLSSSDRNAYNKRISSTSTDRQDIDESRDESNMGVITRDQKFGLNSRRQLDLENTTHLEFGVIPKTVMDQLLDQTQWKVRANGVQELATIMTSLDDASCILPHVVAFISFLCNLLDDVNFKVSLSTLEIYGVLVTKMGAGIKQFLKPLIAALTKCFGDNKVVIRQANMTVLMQLMHVLTPQLVVSALADSLKHRKSGVREEALTTIIAALLTFPSYDFDLPQLCQMLAPTLGDAKRRVRQAGLESFAVLAQAMGPSRISPLIHAVDQVELHMDEEGVMKAVQARLARRRLPRLNDDGLVEYATNIPTSATVRNNTAMSKDNDVQWILKGTGSVTMGARERSHGDPRSLELSQPSPTRSIHSTSNQDTSPPKRYVSAGKGRSKLPWEEEDDSQLHSDESGLLTNSVNRTHISSAPTSQKQDEEKPPPIRARKTWDSNEEIEMQYQRHGPLGSLIDGSPDAGYSGSYRQIHLDKLKRQSLVAPYPMAPGNPIDDYPPGSLSAPSTDRGSHDPFASNTATTPKKRNILSRHESEDPEARLPQHQDKYVSSFGSGSGLRDNSALMGSRGYRKSLSNSWPESHYVPDEGSKGKKKVDPLPESDWSPDYEPRRTKGVTAASPIPLKPALARSAGRKGRAILDPLERNQVYRGTEDILDVESTYADDFDPSDDEESLPNSSLEHVRNSAAKKRAQKLASRDPDKPPSQQSNMSSTMDESGFFSMQSTMNNTAGMDDMERYSLYKKKGKKITADLPFSNKPRMARSSGKGGRKNSTEQLAGEPDAVSYEYSPSSGASFRDKSTADVSIVGQGYGSGTRKHSTGETGSPGLGPGQNKMHNGRDRTKSHKGSLLSPLSMSSMNHPGAVDLDDKMNTTAEDVAMVIGKSVFNGKHSGVNYQLQPTQKKLSELRETRQPLGGVTGQSYRQKSSSSTESDDHIDDEDEEEEEDEEAAEEEEDEEYMHKMAMSKALKDKMTQKQNEQKREQEQQRAEKQTQRDRARQERDERRRLRDKEEMKARERKAEEEQEARRRAIEEERAGRAERRRILEEKEKRRREVEEKRRAHEERKEAQQLALEEEKRQEARRKAAEQEEERALSKQRMLERQREMKLRHQLEMENNNSITDFPDLQISGSNPGSSSSATPEDSDMTVGIESPHSPSKVVGKPPASGPNVKKKKSRSPTESSSPKQRTPVKTDNSQSSLAAGTPVQEPLKNPEKALQDALRCLSDEDWETKLDGLATLRRLCAFHPNEVVGQLHTVVVAVLNEVKNLRSSVSKVAIATMGDLFRDLQTAMDKDLDSICKILIPKGGESNAFIRDDVDRALESMVQYGSPQKVLCSLINSGASHKNLTVRKTTAIHLERLVDKMGPGRLLSGVKDVTDKILPTAARLAFDNAQETRFYGRKMLYSMMQHESFNKLIEKYIPAKDLRMLREMLDNLKQKGLGDLPQDSSSARVRRSHSNTRNNPREKPDSASRDQAPPGTVRKTNRNSSRNSEANQETVKDLCKSLSALDWTERLSAINQLQEMTETNHELITSSVVKIFDNFTPRLTDSNSKVNQAALQTMLTMVPRLGECLATVATSVVPVVSGNLASKNAVICKNSEEILDSIIQHVDMIVLVQPFSSATQYGNARVKPKMVEKLSYLSSKVYPRKQQTVIRNVLPVLWHLLGSLTGSGAVHGGTGNLRHAVKDLARDLHSLMGDALLQHASSLSQRQQNTLNEILSIS